SGPVNTEDLAHSGSIAVHSALNLPPSEVKLTGFPDKPQIVELPQTIQPILKLSSTAQDADGDGIPDLRADGRSTTTLTVVAQTAGGESIKTPATVTFRTTAGRLAARTAELKDGTASVIFTSGRDTIL